jgi:HAD superfamily hydrolase (TIGR01458 family)
MTRAFLIDLDGTVYCDDRVIPGAQAAILQLQKAGIPYRFVTNITTKRRSSIRRKLEDLGIPASDSDIFSAPYAAAQWLRQRPQATSWILTAGDSIEEFHDLTQTEDRPDYVVLGDLQHGFSFELLNQIFRRLLAGSQLIALQKNRYWRSRNEWLLDAGPFVAGLEYAAGKPARLIGKPSLDFFELALADLGVKAEEAIMVGDDAEVDGAGARKAGMATVLVRTGKFRPEAHAMPSFQPEMVIESIADLDHVFSRGQ